MDPEHPADLVEDPATPDPVDLVDPGSDDDDDDATKSRLGGPENKHIALGVSVAAKSLMRRSIQLV